MNAKKYNEAVVIFIDVLGTRDRSDFDELYKIASIFNETVEREKVLDKAHEYTIYKREIRIFSDCAYIIYDYKDGIEEERKDKNALITIACYNTEKVLYEFLKNGFIARGGLTYGDVYYEENKAICFGPAINKAYYLETKLAKYPRVIIDSEYVESLVEYNNITYCATDTQRACNGEIIKKDEDETYYIHFLSTSELGFNQIEGNEIISRSLDLCNLERNKERETEEIRESIKNKYDWLEKYLKASCCQNTANKDIDITNPTVMKQIMEDELQMIKNLWIE